MPFRRGSGALRLVSGTLACHAELEAELASLMSRSAAIVLAPATWPMPEFFPRSPGAAT